MVSAPKLNVSRRIRATPYTPQVEAHGVSGYSVVNHTILPKGFRKTVEEDYWHLKSQVQIWDVGCQRQVELRGADAARLAQLMTPRDLRLATPGQCLYAPLIDEAAGMLNDPIILKLAEDHYWFSIADADILLWAKGLAYGLGLGLDVVIDEPDVWPLAVQGPKSDDVMAAVFGEAVRDIGFFRFAWLPFDGHSMLVARSGYSRQGGFEIYIDNPKLGGLLWEAIWQAGQAFDIAPGSPNLIERVEAGLVSYGNEITRANNPLECGLAQYCQLDGSLDYIGRESLLRIAEHGPARMIRGIRFDGEACPACQHPWPLRSDGIWAGQVTTAIWSPRFRQNVALAMVERGHWQSGNFLEVEINGGDRRKARVCDLPMEDE